MEGSCLFEISNEKMASVASSKKLFMEVVAKAKRLQGSFKLTVRNLGVHYSAGKRGGNNSTQMVRIKTAKKRCTRLKRINKAGAGKLVRSKAPTVAKMLIQSSAMYDVGVKGMSTSRILTTRSLIHSAAFPKSSRSATMDFALLGRTWDLLFKR